MQFRKAWETNTNGHLDTIMNEWGKKDLPELNTEQEVLLEEEPINENE